jgi:LysM repeat protein
MNETTNLNSELLSADARGRKHIPFAVFAVILIHVILFLFLLVAAGCRAKARARRNAVPNAALLAGKSAGVPLAATNAPAAAQPAAAPPAIQPPVVVSEPPVEKRFAEPAAAPLRKAAQKAAPANARRAAGSASKARVYTVKAGDTVEKIARMHRTSVEAIKAENKLKDHMLRPGQQLRVSTQKAKSTDEA